MILNVYNIRDERQGTYGTPIYTEFEVDQIGSQYEKSIETLQANIERYQEFAPEKAAELLLNAASLKDCVLYHVGTFDNKSGEYKACDPILVCRISDYFREVSKNA